MKIDEKLIPLNQEFPPWSTVEDFLISSKLQNTLVKFLDDYTIYLPDLYEVENIVIHALRILSYLHDERVLPFIVEFLNNSQNIYDHELYCVEERDLSKELMFEERDFNRSDEMNDFGYSDDIIITCKQGLELMATNKKFLETFWTLYKVTLDKDIAQEYLGAAIQCSLHRCGPTLDDRISFNIRPRLQKALIKDFAHDPFFCAHYALVTLDTQFIPFLERIINEQLEDFQKSLDDYENEDFLVFWGQIPLTWFILKEIQKNNYQEIEDHIKLFIYEDPIADFHNFYKRSSLDHSNRFLINSQNDMKFRQMLKNEILDFFHSLKSMHRPSKRKINLEIRNNVIPFSRP